MPYGNSALKMEKHPDKWAESEIQTLLSLYATEETEERIFDASNQNVNFFASMQ